MSSIRNASTAVAAAITIVIATMAGGARAETTSEIGDQATQTSPAQSTPAPTPLPAQTPPSGTSRTETPSVADETPTETESLGEVVVTGSRVIRNGMDSPTPVTVLSTQDMAQIMPSGTIADQLNTLPQFAGSRGPQTNPSSGVQGSAASAANPAANVLDLRNMGPQRTLVLFDGHRIAPSSTDGTVDVDAIPQMLLQRVEVVTGGASAVYGSDAVTGVVNFVTDTHFNGVKFKASDGISHYHDDGTVDFGVAAGTDLFDGRGHIEASGETYKTGGVDNRSDRPFGRLRWTFENPTSGANGPYDLNPNVKDSTSSFGGVIIGGPLANMKFGQNGILTPFNTGTPLGPTYHVGGDGAFENSTLSSPLEMNQLYVRFDFDVSNSVHTYAYLSGDYTHTWQQFTYNTLTTPNGTSNGTVTLSSTNAFLPAQYEKILAAAGPTFKYGDTLTDVPPNNIDTWSRQLQAATGVNVKLGHGYEWDSFYSHSENMINSRNNDVINTLNMVAALNAVVNPANNQIVCAVSLTANASRFPGCVPFNPFGPNAASPQAAAYVTQQSQYRAYTTLDDVTTSVTGAPISTWAGPVNSALSGEFRSLSYHLDQNPTPNGPGNLISCAGLPTYGCTVNVTAQQYGAISSPLSVVSQNVGEVALETDIPLLKDVPLAKDFSLNAAGRWTDYSTSGVEWTWKGGFVWKVGDQLTIRGTRSRDIRAPTLNDLYLPPTYSLDGGADFWTHVSAITPAIPNIAKGNPTLVPEIGNTSTVGFIFQPKLVPGLNISVDAFKIDVSDAIQQFRGANQTVMEGCGLSGGASSLCQLIVRPIDCCNTSVANTATTVYTESLNLADQWSEGADFEVDYTTRLQDRPFGVRALATYQPQLVYSAPGSAQYNLAGVAFATGALQATPIWRATLIVDYSPFHNFTVDVRERWRDSLFWGAKYAPPNQTIFNVPQIPPIEYTDLTLSYLFDHPGLGQQAEVYLSANNLFNRQPPAAAYSGQTDPGVFGGFAAGDDPIGAYYTVGVRVKL